MPHYLLLFFAFLIVSCSDVQQTQSVDKQAAQQKNTMYKRLKQLDVPAPLADQHSDAYTRHGVRVTDPFSWLKDPGYPEVDDERVLDYLRRENTYYHFFLEQHKTLVDTLFEEFKGRVNDENQSVPYVENGYEYRTDYLTGNDYPVYLRRPVGEAQFTVFLDVPALAKGHDYFVIGDWAVSPNNQLLAFSVDTNGDESYEIHFLDLSTGEPLQDTILGAGEDVVFATDNQIVYAKLQPGRWHVDSINVRTLGQQLGADQVLLDEADDGFFLEFSLSSSGEFLIFDASRAEVNEISVLHRTSVLGKPIKILTREQGLSASLDHGKGEFFLLVNDQHVNFRLAKAQDDQPLYAAFDTLMNGSDERYLKEMQVFDFGLVIKFSEQAQDKIKILPFHGNAFDIQFPESPYTVDIGVNRDFYANFIRLNYESMVNPETIFDFHLSKKQLEKRKQVTLPSGYQAADYETERVWAPSRDGEQIPVSIVYKKGLKKDGLASLWLYGYGAYGSGIEPSFSSMRLSMLDRGFVFAIAHVRGGDEMGFQWYLDGKLDKRTNTFNDFVDVAEYLIDQRYTSKGNISISGRSAGGELMGVATLQAPDLWRSVTLGVPFVDVMNTMLDASLPLTPPEWLEWGNPIESEADFHHILSYSPYDNIQPEAYPPMMVTGGLNDPRVTYWEPAKWTAKMRALKTDDNLLVMRINMGAGHFANSGRYGRLRDYAEEYAFMLLAHGIEQ